MQLFDVSLRVVWKRRELRVMVLFTLLVQILLIFVGNRRKFSHRIFLRVVVWCAYLTADSVATIALGILSSKIGEVNEKSGRLDDDSKLVSFWAPLLLVLLGGPDTITAYSLEDNALWLRHLLGLAVQTGATIYILFMAWTGSILSVLSSVMLFVGLVKYGERVFTLYLASKEKLRESMLTPPDPSPNYSRFMEEYSLKQAEGYHVTADEVIEVQVPEGIAVDGGESLRDSEPTVKAYRLLQIFKPLFADLILSYDDRDTSRSVFKDMEWRTAYEVIAIELGFMYDTLYTKAMVLHNVWGFQRRLLTFSMTGAVLVSFSLLKMRANWSVVDLTITYCLLVVLILFEVYSLLLLLSSDWTNIWLNMHDKSPAFRKAIARIQLPKQPRWSNHMGQFTFLRFCTKAEPIVCHRIFKALKIDEKVDKYHYMTSEEIPDGLKECIFHQVMARFRKLEVPSDTSTIIAVLTGYGHPDEVWSAEMEFDQIILTWHVATELCHFSDVNFSFDSQKKALLLSRYVLYLVVMYPALLPKGIGQIRLRDTFAEASKFFEERTRVLSKKQGAEAHITKRSASAPSSCKALDLKWACRMLLEVNTEVLPAKVKGGRSKSVLFDGCRLATALNKRQDKSMKWETICNVWVEILWFAASHSGGDSHAHQLRRGGELLTHVWLLIAHFGLTNHFQRTQGHAIAKLIMRQRLSVSIIPVTTKIVCFSCEFWGWIHLLILHVIMPRRCE